MPSEITMPQLSDTMSQGTLVKWLVDEGQKIDAGQEIAEIETDKATMPMEAFEGGVLAYIAAPAGEKVEVGGLIAVVALAGEDAAAVKKQFAEGAPRRAAAGARDSIGDEGSTEQPQTAAADDADDATVEAGTEGEADAEGKADAAGEEGKADFSNEAGRIKVSPLARRRASDLGIDLAAVTGTGPGGRIIERDVQAFSQRGAAGAIPAAGEKPARLAKASAAVAQDRAVKAPPVSLRPALAPGAVEKTPLSKMRTVIAQRLTASKQNIPHFYESIDIDLENVELLRGQMNRALEADGVRLSVADFITRAVAVALGVHPALNANFDGKTITRFGDVNLGLAVSLDDGLIVPVLRGVNQMSLRQIREATADLVKRARAQNLKRPELSGATFSISSLGTYGIRDFSAIINPPEVAILAVGAGEKRAVVYNGQLAARTTMTVTLSADHRVVDGAAAAEFLQTLRQLLQEPGMLLV